MLQSRRGSDLEPKLEVGRRFANPSCPLPLLPPLLPSHTTLPALYAAFQYLAGSAIIFACKMTTFGSRTA